MTIFAVTTAGVKRAGKFFNATVLAVGCLAATWATPSASETRTDRFSGATGGIIRLPENLQPKNKGNLFGEAWAKFGLELARSDKSVTSLFTLGNFVFDSKGFGYNNTAKIGVGLSHSVQVSDALNVTLSARYDWFKERQTDVRRSGIRLATDYYYYKRWEAEPGTTRLRRPMIATVFKSYGTLAYPGSLEKNDTNLVLTIGGELSADLDLPETKWVLSPFADFDLSWDKDRNGYNNKIVPGLGVKIRYPLSTGELFAGVRFSADYRPIEDTLHTGPGIFLGWYKGF